jgi:hypothetical protein
MAFIASSEGKHALPKSLQSDHSMPTEAGVRQHGFSPYDWNGGYVPVVVVSTIFARFVLTFGVQMLVH